MRGLRRHIHWPRLRACSCSLCSPQLCRLGLSGRPAAGVGMNDRRMKFYISPNGLVHGGSGHPLLRIKDRGTLVGGICRDLSIGSCVVWLILLPP
jgi:hypothetical protein